MNIPILTKLREARVDREACVVEGIILGSGLSENGTYYPSEVVERSAEVFKGVQCYADHPGPGETERSVRDVVGVIEDAWPDEGRLRATIRLSRAHDWLMTMIGENLVGDLSINALGKTRVCRRDGRVVREVQEITKAHSVDFVAKAAAGGRVEKIIRESAGYREGLRLLERIQLREFMEARPDIVQELREEVRKELLEVDTELKMEIGKLEAEAEARRVGLEKEFAARKLVEASGLPEKAKEYVLKESIALHFESEDSYGEAVKGLIERQRKYLAGLASEGLIRGMGSEKQEGREKSGIVRETLRLMGVNY